MKFKTPTALSFALMTLFGALASAQTTTAIDDGLKVELSLSEVEDLKRWTENAKTKIDILLDDIRYYSLSEKREALLTGFRSIAQQSVNKDNELLMAIVLRRAVRVSEIVGSTSQESELQSLVSLLETSAQKAQTFYVDDQDYLNAIANQVAPKTRKNMSVFGYEYAEYILNLAPTFLNSKTEYQLTRTAIGWFGNDLNSNRNALDRPLFSDEIVRISALLAQHPADPPGSPEQVRKSIRNLKFQIRERVLPGALVKVSGINETQIKKEIEAQSDLELINEVQSLFRISHQESLNHFTAFLSHFRHENPKEVRDAYLRLTSYKKVYKILTIEGLTTSFYKINRVRNSSLSETHKDFLSVISTTGPFEISVPEGADLFVKAANIFGERNAFTRELFEDLKPYSPNQMRKSDTGYINPDNLEELFAAFFKIYTLANSKPWVPKIYDRHSISIFELVAMTSIRFKIAISTGADFYINIHSVAGNYGSWSLLSYFVPHRERIPINEFVEQLKRVSSVDSSLNQEDWGIYWIWTIQLCLNTSDDLGAFKSNIDEFFRIFEANQKDIKRARSLFREFLQNHAAHK